MKISSYTCPCTHELFAKLHHKRISLKNVSDPQMILIAKYNVFYSTRSNTRINTFVFCSIENFNSTHFKWFQCSPKKATPTFSSPTSPLAILRLFNHGFRGDQLLFGLVQTIQTVEVENLRSDRVTQLFRGNTSGCKIVSTFTTSIGRHYLQMS